MGSSLVSKASEGIGRRGRQHGGKEREDTEEETAADRVRGKVEREEGKGEEKQNVEGKRSAKEYQTHGDGVLILIFRRPEQRAFCEWAWVHNTPC